MNGTEILVITEGATERAVGKVLWERRILSPAGTPRPPDWKSVVGTREGYEQVIGSLKEENPIAPLVSDGNAKVLLIFDCEDSTSLVERMQKIESDLKRNDAPGFWSAVSFNGVP